MIQRQDVLKLELEVDGEDSLTISEVAEALDELLFKKGWVGRITFRQQPFYTVLVLGQSPQSENDL